jgi:hypothetical protein
MIPAWRGADRPEVDVPCRRGFSVLNSRRHLVGFLSIALAAQGVTAQRAVDPPAAKDPDLTVLESAATVGPLLREGTFVLQVVGSLHRAEQPGWWVFRSVPDESGKAPFALTLLPCTLLGSLEKLVESMPDQEIVFDLTGQVFVYQGRNYLMPTHAPRLVEYVPASQPDGFVADDESAPRGDSAESILRDLDRTVGPVVRSPRIAAPDLAAGPEAGATSRDHRPAGPGAMILWRRGWMVRESDGAWSFVFAADASGLEDPPMILLPCRMLEDLQRHARRSGPDKPLLLTGRVTRYHGRSYLLPTMFRIPRHNTALRP